MFFFRLEILSVRSKCTKDRKQFAETWASRKTCYLGWPTWESKPVKPMKHDMHYVSADKGPGEADGPEDSLRRVVSIGF